jgi:hypothetical protein
MPIVNWRMMIARTLSALAVSVYALAQVTAPVVLRIDYENGVRYVYDSVDIPAFATVPAPTNQLTPTFANYVILGDVVAVNGQPAKGLFLTRQITLNLTPNPAAGQAISDVTRQTFLDRMVEIEQPDGTPIGSISTVGFNLGAPPPGAPTSAMSGSFVVTGGTGAFLGVRGQAVDGGVAVANRIASVKEDPARRRTSGGGRASAVFQLSPMFRPEIVMTPGGPAVTHSSDFSLVTASNPAAAGEVLSIFATGLGAVRPGVDPGQPFPANPLAAVNSPVAVIVNGKPSEVLAAVGYPGATDSYQVNFRIPPDTAKGTASIELTAAWIPGSPVNIPVRTSVP